ncbi:MAG: hypothetical protein RQ745_12900, partial [Longimicrobiales bacterium]|nr:hypothetical protein [Longimicrobiales bacterium]
PPLALVTDAALLGTHVDGVVIVARANRTEKGALTYAADQLRNVRAVVLGTVLNDVDSRRDGRYGSRYGMYGYAADAYYGAGDEAGSGAKSTTSRIARFFNRV